MIYPKTKEIPRAARIIVHANFTSEIHFSIVPAAVRCPTAGS